MTCPRCAERMYRCSVDGRDGYGCLHCGYASSSAHQERLPGFQRLPAPRRDTTDRKQRQHPELDACVALMDWVTLNRRRLPGLDRITHIPNEGSGSRARGVQMQQAGVRAGVLDYALPVARRGYHGAWIEMKHRGRKPSAEQMREIEALRNDGYAAMWFDDWMRATRWLEWYLGEEG